MTDFDLPGQTESTFSRKTESWGHIAGLRWKRSDSARDSSIHPAWKPRTLTSNVSWKWRPFTWTLARSIARRSTFSLLFDFMYTGNHDEVVAEALGLNTTLESLMQMPGRRC